MNSLRGEDLAALATRWECKAGVVAAAAELAAAAAQAAKIAARH